MFSRVLVAVDSSPGSRVAARVAAQLARSQKGRVHACYVIDTGQVSTVGTPIPIRGHLRETLERDGRRALAQVERLCKRLRVPYRGTLAEGAVSREILTAARKSRAQVIVMGTEGLGRLWAFVLGSRAHEVLSEAPCPVLLVRRPGAARARRR